MPDSVKSASSIAKFKQGLENNNLVDITQSKLYNNGPKKKKHTPMSVKNI